MNFQIQQEKFEGPLELLVELIENEKLSISEISLAKVTDDYIRYVRSLEQIDPEMLAEFLVVAAELMLVKSRSLLPGLELSERDEASIDELTTRLEEYKRIRERAKEIKNLIDANGRIFTREQYQGMESFFYPPAALTAPLIHDIFTAFLAAIPKVEKLEEDKIKRIVSLEERIAHVRNFIETTVTQSFSELIKNSNEKVDVIVSFLAILELAKQKFIDLDQKDLFGDIMIKRTPQ